MAQSLRRPLSQIAGISSSLQCRQFSHISSRWAKVEMSAPTQRQRQKSLQVMQKEFLAAGKLPSDMGLLEKTFVPPILTLSSLFKTPSKYLRFQWTRLRFGLASYMSLVYVKTQSPRGGKRWYNRSYYIHSSKVCPTAIDLHTKMYAAFAEGDLRTLGEICTDGILESYKARIKLRKRGEVVKWELLKYNGSPKVVSDRAAIVPGTDGMVIRQAVVRIASRQRLTRYMGGKMVEGTGKEKDVCEYVVLQNTTLKWKNKGWQVWGTTKETTIEDLAKIWS